MTDLDQITDPDELVDAIAKLADDRQAIDDQIKSLTIHAVRDLGVRRYTAAAAAMISRPTLNRWLDAERSN